MAFVLKEGQGTLFRNAKEGNEARPDYRGELNIAGAMWRISGWIKEGKNGKWMSLSCDLKEDRSPAPISTNAKPFNPDEDIPF